MDSFRLSLLLVGVLIIVGIYLWGSGITTTNKNRFVSSRKKKHEPILDTPVIKPKEEEFDYTDVFRREGGIPMPSAEKETMLQSELDFDQPHDQTSIIILYITSPAGFSFHGVSLAAALKRGGMVLTEDKIFHHYGVGQSRTDKPVFSVANMVEPGTFDQNDLENFRSEGIAFFLQLPAVIDSAVAFELMLATAQTCAELLRGHVRDENHDYLSAQKIEIFRSLAASQRL